MRLQQSSMEERRSRARPREDMPGLSIYCLRRAPMFMPRPRRIMEGQPCRRRAPGLLRGQEAIMLKHVGSC
jgi:hypothetical protein